MKSRAYTDIVLFKRLMSEARPYWPHIGAIFVVSMLAAPLVLLTPVPLKIAVDSVLGSEPVPGFLDGVLPSSDTGLLVATAAMFVVIALLTQLQDIGNLMLKTYTGEKLVLRFRGRLFQHSQRLSLTYHDRVGTADSTYRIQYDAMSLQYVAVESVISLITAVTTLVAMIYVTYRIDPQLAIVAMAVSPPIILAAKVFRPRMRRRSREVKKIESSSLSIVQEVLTGLRVVKSFGREDQEQERFIGRSGEGVRARIRLALVQGAYALLVGVLIGAGGAAVLYVGVRSVQQNKMTLGELLLVMGYLTQLYAPLKTMARKAGSLQNHLASAERAFSILDEEPEVPERPDARPLGRATGAVEFRDVSFSYEPDHPVLEHVSFMVEPGDRVGIAGPTGAGKSTLMSLLTRFYDPTSGAILLDGVDLRDYKLADLRDQFGIVLQEPVLFSTSIGENIAYARPDASDAEVEAAARAANAHDFIVRLPDGYMTQVGERGMRLSGGERQRISLARAFLRDSPILILDEPTSSVDIATEAVIMEAMERLMSGRTSFMIAHRLSTLDACTRRLEIDHGRVVDRAVEAATDSRTRAVDRAGLEEHPAVRAWGRLRPGETPRSVTVLREPKRSRRSAAYRLEGCESEAKPVIAKLCRRDGGELERTIYREILPRLQVPALRCHGMVDEDEQWCWIFLEDGGREHYSPLSDEHRRLAGRWLADLHASAIEDGAASSLPDTGPSHYLTQLVSARDALLDHISGTSLSKDELRQLIRVMSQLDQLESRWDDVSGFCDTLPRTVVHGDFVRKNLRVRPGGAGAALVAFDWERAGWGVPAVDLAQLATGERMRVARQRTSGRFNGFCADPCLEVYRSTLEARSMPLSRATVERMADMGGVFRCVASIDWACMAMSPEWSPVAPLELPSRWLAHAMQACGWNGGNGHSH